MTKNSLLWDESLDGLLVLWAREQRRRGAVVNDADLPDWHNAMLGRARKVLAYTQLQPEQVIRTRRQWEACWSWQAAWNLLSSRLQVFGWTARRVPAGTPESQPERLALASEGDTVLILEEPLVERLALLEATKCPFPLTVQDLAVLDLGAELYRIATGKMGMPPRDPRVDDLAVHAFLRMGLGLPFEPLAVELATLPQTRYAPRPR